jgi:Domain of unknown function (DUF222)/HNH endonuclease
MQQSTASIQDAPTREGLALLADGLSLLAGRPLSLLADPDLLAFNRELTAVTAQIQALRLGQLAEIDDRDAAGTVGASSTLAWVKGATLARHGHAVRDLRLAQALGERYGDTATSLAAGDVSVEHAEVIRACLDALPSHVDTTTRQDAERRLLGEARRYDPAALHRLGQHLHTVLDPDGPDDLARKEDNAHDARELWVQTYDDGRVRLRGSLDPEAGALFMATLEPLARRRTDDPEPDERTAAQRRADAFAEITRLASAHPDLPTARGARPTLVVNVSWDDLRDQVGAGMLDTGAAVTPVTVRRLACDAGIIPALLGTRPQPLGIGRKTRVVPTSIRRALVLRDRHCRFPGCRRPPAQCQSHHIIHWADGGPTELPNLTLLCDHHHRVVHSDGWTIGPRPGAPPTFQPPPWARGP